MSDKPETNRERAFELCPLGPDEHLDDEHLPACICEEAEEELDAAEERGRKRERYEWECGLDEKPLAVIRTAAEPVVGLAGDPTYDRSNKAPFCVSADAIFALAAALRGEKST